MKLKSKNLMILFSIIFISLIIIFPEISKSGISRGLILTTNIVIPSLFPFLVCVLMIMKSNITVNNYYINNLIYKVFGYNFNVFFVFVLSLLGGYPVGAKLINELVKNNTIDEKTANIMITYCVNAGPSFIVLIVGDSFKSKNVGIILLIAHVFSSITLALLCSKKITKINSKNKIVYKSFSSCFVESVNDAIESIINISGFIIIFSSINCYIDYFLSNIKILNFISYLTEVTSSVIKCNNIYIVSFLLGFSGISIWCQIFSITKNYNINKIRFVLSRLIHGALSVLITKILLKLFQIKIPTFSNNINYSLQYMYSDVVLLSSMIVMIISFLMFLYFKNNSGKFFNDVI